MLSTQVLALSRIAEGCGCNEEHFPVPSPPLDGFLPIPATHDLPLLWTTSVRWLLDLKTPQILGDKHHRLCRTLNMTTPQSRS